MSTIHISGVVRQSIVDGPGLRFVVFTQGCPHRCAGCHNPHTHDFAGGYDCEVEKILAEVDKNPLLAGVTLSGGEPFSQAERLLPLAQAVKERGLNLFAYSGYTYEQLLEMGATNPSVISLLNCCDFLVDGPFVEELRDLTLLFRGSANQRVLNLQTIRETGRVEHQEPV